MKPIRIVSIITAIAVAALSLISARAQQGSKPTPQTTQSSGNQDAGQKEVVNIKNVLLPVTVTDRKNQFVMGLTQQDFLIFEDKQPQTIVSFTTEEKADPPLYVGVLMDTSPSVAGKLKFEQESAISFIQTVIRPRRDRVAFVTFDHQITLRQDFTNKLDLLEVDDSNYSDATLKCVIDRPQGAEVTVFPIAKESGISGSFPGVSAAT